MTYPSVEKAAAKLRQPLLMIHGEGDTYIKMEMAKALFDRVRGPKELWPVAKAKHNQALHAAGDEYHRRLVAFFDAHLGHGERHRVSGPGLPPRNAARGKLKIAPRRKQSWF